MIRIDVAFDGRRAAMSSLMFAVREWNRSFIISEVKHVSFFPRLNPLCAFLVYLQQEQLHFTALGNDDRNFWFTIQCHRDILDFPNDQHSFDDST
jgi:hypothetical protein